MPEIDMSIFDFRAAISDRVGVARRRQTPPIDWQGNKFFDRIAGLTGLRLPNPWLYPVILPKNLRLKSLRVKKWSKLDDKIGVNAGCIHNTLRTKDLENEAKGLSRDLVF